MVCQASQTATKDPKAAFRRARARLAAYALHHKRPDIAREAGRKGGEATSQRYALGKQAWAVAMALRRWHGTPFVYVGSGAPSAGPGGNGGGAPLPGPARARSAKRVANQEPQPAPTTRTAVGPPEEE